MSKLNYKHLPNTGIPPHRGKLRHAQELPLSLPRKRIEHCSTVSSGLVTEVSNRKVKNIFKEEPQ